MAENNITYLRLKFNDISEKLSVITDEIHVFAYFIRYNNIYGDRIVKFSAAFVEAAEKALTKSVPERFLPGRSMKQVTFQGEFSVSREKASWKGVELHEKASWPGAKLHEKASWPGVKLHEKAGSEKTGDQLC